MQKITPFLWFNGDAEEAITLYTSVFKNSKSISVNRWGDGGPAPKGSVMSGTIQIEGQELIIFNGGPMFKFTEAISLFVSCDTQEEIDDKWEKLSEGGQKQACGWLKDKFGVSWQIIPPILMKLMGDKDPKKSKAVMEAMLKMTKIDISLLQQAYDKA
jgi:predicted 3-demethylubiquinone-9 3-methyltransferase (glyoxalase superfamily)